MSNSIKKAIFVVAGSGSRFLPYTKAQAKEMLPIVDKPIIQYLVEEAVEAGIKEIIFVTAKGKESIENHFDRSLDLEYNLKKRGKTEMLNQVQAVSNLAQFSYVRQAEPLGDGHALLCARPWIGDNENVLMVFPDYIMPKCNQTFAKLISAHEKYKQVIIGTDFVDPLEVCKYGVMEFGETDDEEIVKIHSFVEKPKSIELAPSNMINNGYGVITPDLWNYLEKVASAKTGTSQEIRVADAYTKMLEDQKLIYAVKSQKMGYDCGQPLGFLKAVIDFALERDDLRDDLLKYIATKKQN
jgi:UTP--glucose-1-phosphate uridylyltransferase